LKTIVFEEEGKENFKLFKGMLFDFLASNMKLEKKKELFDSFSELSENLNEQYYGQEESSNTLEIGLSEEEVESLGLVIDFMRNEIISQREKSEKYAVYRLARDKEVALDEKVVGEVDRVEVLNFIEDHISGRSIMFK